MYLRRYLLISLFIITLSLIPAISLAQDESPDMEFEEFTSDDDFISLIHPEGWSVVWDSAFGEISLTNKEGSVEDLDAFQPGEYIIWIVLIPEDEEFRDTYAVDPWGNPDMEAILEIFKANIAEDSDGTIIRGPELVELADDRYGIEMWSDEDGYLGMFVFFKVNGKIWAAAIVMGNKDEIRAFGDYHDVVVEIIASLEYRGSVEDFRERGPAIYTLF